MNGRASSQAILIIFGAIVLPACSAAPRRLSIPIKRAGMIISVLIGAFWFRESGWRPRLLGATVMASGVALILTS